MTIIMLPAMLVSAGHCAGEDGIQMLSHSELADRLDADEPPFLLDVRGSGEFRTGHIPKAVNIPRTELADRIDELPAARDRQVVVYCEDEYRARAAIPTLRKAGFSSIYCLSGGMAVWRKHQHPMTQPESGTTEHNTGRNRRKKNKTDRLVVHFFGASTCGHCRKIKRELLEPLAEKYEDKLDLHFHDTNNKEESELMFSIRDVYGEHGNRAQLLLVSDRVLCGFDEIMNSGRELIIEYLNRPQQWYAYDIDTNTPRSGLGEDLRKKADKFSIFGIMAAGIADGLNPCAIATIIFLISFLTTQKRERSEVLAAGLSFTAAVYITYLLLGVGAFTGLVELEGYHWLSEGLRWAAIVLATGIGILCFADAFRYGRTQDTSAIRIQLPDAVKSRIHNVIKSGLSGTQLIASAFAVGFLVTLLEAVCTGQVYLPTIVLMTKSESLRLHGWLYLLFYCFLFVLPLLITMILAYFGLTWQRLSQLTKRHLVVLKVLLGIVLLALAAFLLIAG